MHFVLWMQGTVTCFKCSRMCVFLFFHSQVTLYMCVFLFFHSRVTFYADLFQKLFGCENILHTEIAKVSFAPISPSTRSSSFSCS